MVSPTGCNPVARKSLVGSNPTRCTMKFTLPDNNCIEVVNSDGYSGPTGRPGCQRCGSAVWYRINDSNWKITKHRHLHKLLEWIKMSENLEDFFEGEK